MGLPVTAILALLDLAQNERVHKGLAGLWAKLPFGKDAKVAARVEGRAQALSTELGSLARTMGSSDLEAELERRFARFEKEIVSDGVSADQALTVRAEVEKTLRAAVIEPVLAALALQHRIEDLEARVEQAEAKLARSAVHPMTVQLLGLAVLLALIMATVAMLRH